MMVGCKQPLKFLFIILKQQGTIFYTYAVAKIYMLLKCNNIILHMVKKGRPNEKEGREGRFRKFAQPYKRRINICASLFVQKCPLQREQCKADPYQYAGAQISRRGVSAVMRVVSFGQSKFRQLSSRENFSYYFSQRDLLFYFGQLRSQGFKAISLKEALLVYACYLSTNELLSESMLQYIQRIEPAIESTLIDLEEESATKLGLGFSQTFKKKKKDVKTLQNQLFVCIVHLLIQTAYLADINITL